MTVVQAVLLEPAFPQHWFEKWEDLNTAALLWKSGGCTRNEIRRGAGEQAPVAMTNRWDGQPGESFCAERSYRSTGLLARKGERTLRRSSHPCRHRRASAQPLSGRGFSDREQHAQGNAVCRLGYLGQFREGRSDTDSAVVRIVAIRVGRSGWG